MISKSLSPTELLDFARDKVAHYKPKMEEICGIDLGPIQVKDYGSYFNDFTQHKLQQMVRRYTERRGREPPNLLKEAFVSSYSIMCNLVKPAFILGLVVSDASYSHSSIYLPFYPVNRLLEMTFRRRERQLDSLVVHELSHRLWECLDGKNDVDYEKIWSEGFAVYCANNYFASLYPPNTEIRQFNRFSVYRKGQKRIKELVDQHGEQILFEIPKRWPEFESREGKDALPN